MSVRALFIRSLSCVALAAVSCMAGGAWAPAPAMTFHTFIISEAYTTVDGQIQFIELKENSNFGGQNLWNGLSIIAQNADFSVTHTFTFPSNLPSAVTANKRVLLATAGFGALPGGVTPDFVIPPNFLFTSGRIQFAGLVGNADVTYANLPTNGFQSFGFPGGTTVTNSPTNFAGVAGQVMIPSGSCCIGAACTVTVASGCTGTFTAMSTCSPNPCAPPATGACCNGLNCAVQTSAACGGSGGVYKGNNVACGSVGNPIACCPANFNLVGGVTVQDIFDFLSAYFSNDLAADFNHVGGVTVQDIFDFLSACFTPCPG